MSIRQIIEKGKSLEKELFVSLLVILMALLAFGLGRLFKIEGCREPIQIENVEVKN